METEKVKISELKPYEKNAKKHPQKQIKQIAESIKEFGFNQPLVIQNNKIVVGHGRYEAAKLLSWEEVPVIKKENLTKQQIKAYRLTDNKLNESDWDMDLVLKELQGLDEELVELTGFGEYLLELNEVESVDVSFDRLGVITIMPPESPKLKEKAILYIDDFEKYKKIKEAIVSGKLKTEDILDLV